MTDKLVRYVLTHEIPEYEAQGWVVSSLFDDNHHGYHSALMEKEEPEMPRKEPLPAEKVIHSAEHIAKTAASLVAGDREASHGSKYKNHANIASLWTAYLRNAGLIAPTSCLWPEDVANLMELLKIARRQHGSFNLDDFVDGAGYAAVAGEITWERTRGS